MGYRYKDSVVFHILDHCQVEMMDYSSYMGQGYHMLVETPGWLAVEMTDDSSHLGQGYHTMAKMPKRLEL
jgi:hypothetical protein